MKIACIQMRSGRDMAANLVAVRDMIAKAADAGATYVQTPEMSNILDMDRKAMFEKLHSFDDDPFVAAMAEAAKNHAIWLQLGSVALRGEADQDRAVNRGVLFSPSGSIVACYDKIHMFDVDLGKGQRWRESSGFAPGNECLTVNTGDAIIGLGICYDVRFPHFARAQAQAGAGVLTFPSSFMKSTGEAHWHALLRARAIENGAFVLAAAQGGEHEDGRQTFGHSLAYDPWGRLVGELDHDTPGVLVCELDFDEVDRARSKVPALKNDRTFSVRHVEAETAVIEVQA